jgi:predicted glycoside hydrolase/deacetylase ChbG (UPF0249 family)
MNNIKFQADDFGYNNNVIKEIIRLYQAGKIRTFAVLADFINNNHRQKLGTIHELSLRNDISITKFLKNKPVVLHVNLVEGKKYSPLPLFVLKLLLGLTDFKALRKDIQRQVDVLKSYGANVIGLNTHQHTGALYPVSEILSEIAKKNNLKLTVPYRNLAAQTIRAKLCLGFLKLTSCLSYFRYKLKIGLPGIWQVAGNQTYFMSWEDKNFSADKLEKDTETDLIIHPGTKFDKNNNFKKYIS